MSLVTISRRLQNSTLRSALPIRASCSIGWPASLHSASWHGIAGPVADRRLLHWAHGSNRCWGQTSVPRNSLLHRSLPISNIARLGRGQRPARPLRRYRHCRAGHALVRSAEVLCRSAARCCSRRA